MFVELPFFGVLARSVGLDLSVGIWRSLGILYIYIYMVHIAKIRR